MTGTRVLVLQYANPAAYPPVAHGVHLLAEAGCTVLLIGTRRRGDTLEFPPGAGVELDLLETPGAGWRQKAHYARFAAHLLGRTRQWRPDWIYVVDPLATPAALAAARIGPVRFIYHELDAPEAHTASSPAMRGILRTRALLARRAELCIVPGPGRARRLWEETGARRIQTVWNCPRRQDVGGPRPAASAGPLRVLYHGSIVPARLPMTVIDALAVVQDASLGIAGYETAGHPGYVAALLARAHDRGLAGRVCWAGTLPARADLLAHADGFDVGLALLPSVTRDFNEQTMLGASNKPFDYLARGLALLVGDRPEWRAGYVDAGVARTCGADSAAGMAAELRWFAEHPAETRAMGERGRQRVLSDWNFDRGFAPVLDVIAAAQSAAAPHAVCASRGTDAGRH